MQPTTRQQIISYLAQQKTATAAELGVHLGISAPALFKQLKKLQEERAIKKRGTPPTVTYMLETRQVRQTWDFNHYANKEWYHQRFDGSPQFIAMIGEAETRVESRKPRGTEARWRICFFAAGKADWYLDQEDIQRGADAIMALAQTHSDARALMHDWQSDEQAFDDYFTHFSSKDLTKLSDIELYEAYETFHGLAINRFTSSSVIDHFALGTDQLIADMIRQEAGKIAEEKDFNKVFSVATAPIHQSFINEAEIQLLEIASRVQKGELLNSLEIQSLLQTHQQRYYWLNNNYVKAQVLGIEHFEKEVESWLESGRNLDDQLQQLKNTPHRNKESKQALVASFSPLLQNLIRFSEDFTRWQDERKRATYLCIHMGSTLLQEMCHRRTTPLEWSKYILPVEVEDWFLRGAISDDELADRQSGCAVIWEEGVSQVFRGQEKDSLHAIVLPDTSDETVSDIRGLVACTGKAVGRAKILLSAEEIHKVEEGDVLIAVMTRPDYVPAMRRASAIVTNEGGITCHAAIVSRELGVPCIIGTKVATRVFKDGDMVEVNANHNWVRKVAR